MGRHVWCYDDGFCYIQDNKMWKLAGWRGDAVGDPVLYIDDSKWSVHLPDNTLLGSWDPSNSTVYYGDQQISTVYDGGPVWVAELNGREIRSSKEWGGSPGDAAYGAIFWNLFGNYLG